MNMMSIASGSDGNCIFVGSERTSLLIDTGISLKRIEAGLKTIDRKGTDLDGILVTHEHLDHIKGLGVISRKYGIPMYATRGTICGILNTRSLGELNTGLFHEIQPDVDFSIGDIQVTAHSIWHDANDPVCYSLKCQGKKIAVATDMGDYNDYILDALMDSDALLVEANHDIRMLEAGPYPYPLKQRILGRNGHLSNESCGHMLLSLLNNHLKHVFLGHLSQHNNFPALAFETVKNEIEDNPFTNDVRDFDLQVASRNEPGRFVEI
jgi:phosphoribosyl 1,2-cyclic phosphodiesterase